jgi:hypothetical protein
VQVGGAPPPPGRDALAEQVDDVVEIPARQRCEGSGPSDQAEQFVFGPFLRGAFGHDLLGQDVQRRDGLDDRVQPPVPDAAQQRRALHELVPAGRVQQAPRGAETGVVGPAHPLQERGEAARRADLADQLDRPDVDAQLQRGGRHEGPQVTGPQPRLHPSAALLRQAAVVCGDLLLAEPLPELVGDPLRHPPGVDEHQRRAVTRHLLGDAIQDLPHLLGRGHRGQLVVGKPEGEVEGATVPDVDDGAAR